MNISLPSDVAALGEPLPITEATGDGQIAIVVNDAGHHTLKLVRPAEGGFVSGTPTFYAKNDPNVIGFFPIVGRKGVNHVMRPKFEVGQRVLVRHQLDLGVCTVSNRCAVTDTEFMDGGLLTRVGFYVRIDGGKGKKNMGYHEGSLEAEILHTIDPPSPFIGEPA